MAIRSPRYRIAGERHLFVELDDEVTLETNFKAIALSQALLEASPLASQGIRAIIDVIPSFTSVLVHYEPQLITYQGLRKICEYSLQKLSESPNLEIASRLIEIPLVYNDRWCRACFEEYCKTVKPIEDNIELVCRLNGLSSLAELVKCHSASEWWVGAVGFIAGLPTLTPLNPQTRLQAPKYDPPRTWTPQGTVGLGGGFTTIYPVIIPDGYQMIGRTPVPIFDPQKRLEPFQNSPLLFRVGDRVKFRPICEDEFESIEQDVDSGSFRFSISTPQLFSQSQYLHASSSLVEAFKPQSH